MSKHALVLLVALAACTKGRPPAGAVDTTEEVGPIDAPVAPVVSPEQRRDEAARLIAEGSDASLLRARTLLEQVTKETPKDAVAWYDLGVVAWRLGAVEQGAEAFSRATAVDPKLAAAWRGLGVAEQQLGDLRSALKRFEKGLAVAPEDLDLHVARIDALRVAGRPQDAVDAAKEALAVDTRSLAVYDLMGLAWRDLGEIELARFVFEKAENVEGAESNGVLQANFGWTLYLAGERYAAEQRLKRAVELDPSFVPGLVYLARLYLDDRNYVDTVPLLEAAVKRAPDDQGVLVDLGTAYRGLGRLEDAQRTWEKALSLRPDDPLPLFNLGILLGDDLKRYDDAVARLTAYVEAGGEEAELAQTYIDDLERERRKAEAQRKREEERRKRAAEREEQQRLLREAEEKAAREAEEAAGEPDEQEPAPPANPWDTPQ